MNTVLSTTGGLLDHSREYLALMLLTGGIGVTSFAINSGPALGGNGVDAARAAMGLLGLAAAVSMWRQPRIGWMLGLLWAVLQIPIYAWSTSGSPTLQVLSIPITMTSQTSINGQTSSYSQLGINLAGVILAIWIYRRRDLFQQTP